MNKKDMDMTGTYEIWGDFNNGQLLIAKRCQCYRSPLDESPMLAGGDNWAKDHEKLHRSTLYVQ